MFQEKDFILAGGQICTPASLLENACLVIKAGYITDIVSNKPPADINKNLPVLEVDSSHFVLPGFIDMHIHGTGGADIMDGSAEALQVIGSSLYTQGVTGFLATTMTDSDTNITRALRAVSQYQGDADSPTQARALGIHLEGPFLSGEKAGAQSGKWLRPTDIDLFCKWQQAANGLIKQVTLAPEEDHQFKLINHLNHRGIIASIGHTGCSAQQATNAIQAGASHATHLFNAMTGVAHRNPGAATAILLDSTVSAELIVDGVHLAPEIVRLAVTVKGVDKVILITDAMRAQSMGEGTFTLGGQTVIVRDQAARLENGVLAGSVLTMNRALSNMISFSGCSLVEAAKMASTNPAQKLGLLKTGSIVKGNKADLVILDDRYQVVQTFVT